MQEYEPDFDHDDDMDEDAPPPFDLAEAVKAARPDRYEQASQEWMHPVADKLAEQDQRTRDELSRLAALAKVRRVEADQAKAMNAIWADLEDDGLPLWEDLTMLHKALVSWHDYPLMVGPHRVRLGAAEVRDLEEYLSARKEERMERDAREASEDRGISNLVNAMKAHGIERVGAI
jgi:hypothetical protein